MRGTLLTWAVQGLGLWFVARQLVDFALAVSATSQVAIWSIVTLMTMLVTTVTLLATPEEQRSWTTLAARGLVLPLGLTMLTGVAVHRVTQDLAESLLSAIPWLLGAAGAVAVAAWVPWTLSLRRRRGGPGDLG